MEIEGIIKDRDFKTSLLSDKNHVIGVTFQHRDASPCEIIWPNHAYAFWKFQYHHSPP